MGISTKTTDKPIWPYTLDYAIPHECKIKSCPTKAFPGVWEIPVNLHYIRGLASGQCSYLDQCVFALLGSEDVFEWLQEDFRRHYDGNRAPYMLPFHTNWFTHVHQVEGLKICPMEPSVPRRVLRDRHRGLVVDAGAFRCPIDGGHPVMRCQRTLKAML